MVGAVSVCLLIAGCGGADTGSTSSPAAESSASRNIPSALSADEERLLADLRELPLSTEGPFYTDAPLSLSAWTAAVNDDCRNLVDSVLAVERPDEAEGAEAIASYIVTIQERSEAAYKTIAARTPPAEDQPRIREEFLRPYFEQLNASQRLQRDFVAARADQSVGEQIISEATEAKRRLTVFAAKNELTDCIN